MRRKKGENGADDRIQAYKWIELACNKVYAGKPDSDKKDDDEFRRQLGLKMTAEQITQAKKFADAWKATL